MFHFSSKGGYYLSAAFIQARPLIEHMHTVLPLQVQGVSNNNADSNLGKAMNNISDNHHYNVIRCKLQISQYIIVIQPDCGFDVDLL